MNFPKWSDMPKSQCMVTLSWAEVYYTAEQITQKEFKREPTKKEIKELFEIIIHKGLDTNNYTFWRILDYHCQKYYGEIKSKLCDCGCNFEIGSKEFQEKHVNLNILGKYISERLESKLKKILEKNS